MRRFIVQLAFVTAAAILLANQCSASPGPQSGQPFPRQPMPPDLVAPPDSKPPQSPKPMPMPQSDAPVKAEQTPVQPSPAVSPATASRPATLRNKHRARREEQRPPEPPPQQVVTPPPPPPTPQQMPPSPPQVQYRNGLLTISANNSTLSDVLIAVRNQTGANITLAPNMTDRIYAQLGPAPPRDVVSKLMSGTNFNYMLVGSPQDSNALSQVIITMRQGGAAGGSPFAQNQPAPASTQQSRLPGFGAQENNEEEEQTVQQQPAPQQPVQPSIFGAPATAPGGPGPIQPNPAMAPPNVANPTPFPATPGPAPTGVSPVQPQPGQPPQPKTPEQLLQELKQMQQQQQKPPKS